MVLSSVSTSDLQDKLQPSVTTLCNEQGLCDDEEAWKYWQSTKRGGDHESTKH